MTRDLALDEAAGTVVLDWSTAGGGLLLRVRGQTEAVRLICRCGRGHWIVHEVDSDNGSTLVLICHHCGARGSFPLARVRTSAR